MSFAERPTGAEDAPEFTNQARAAAGAHASDGDLGEGVRERRARERRDTVTNPARIDAAQSAHTPAMVAETVLALSVSHGGSYIDCNLGDGGHSEAVLKAGQSVRVLGIDLDRAALDRAKRRLAAWHMQVSLHHGNFADVAQIARRNRFGRAGGVLFDLGFSSSQIDDPERGFSFRLDAGLDMRFNRQSGLSAYEIVNKWPLARLEETIRELGDEPRAGRVARAIVRSRRIDTTGELAYIVSRALNWPIRSRNHPATRTFQALRMAVNEEVANLQRGLAGAVEVLEKGGRLVVISYQSVEDRIAKRFIRDAAAECVCPTALPECRCETKPALTVLSKRVIKPSVAEVRDNPRVRSARMRVAEKL